VTGKLVFENLKHRPMRSLLSVLLIAVPVTLILTLVGLSRGMIEDSQRRQRASGADIVLRAPSAKSAIMQSNAALSEAFVDRLAQEPHVTAVTGVVSHAIELVIIINGVDLDQVNRMTGGIRYLKGGPFQGPYDVILDRYYAEQKHKTVGDYVDLMNRPWHICGVMEGSVLSHILVPLKTLQDLDAESHRLGQIYIKLDNPANTDLVVGQLKAQLPDYAIWPMEELTSQIQESVNAQGLGAFVIVIMAIGVVIGFAVVCLSMYMSVLQRTREIGILKSLGGSKGFILQIILTEAWLMGIGGTVFGILLSFGSRYAIQTFQPASFQMDIVLGWWPRVLALTLAAATLGALYPGLSAAAHDPIEALAYE
jgi:putative ABC transport system permease protein